MVEVKLNMSQFYLSDLPTQDEKRDFYFSLTAL